MQITLYRAAEELRSLLEQIDPETGVLPDGFEQTRQLVASKSQAVTAFILSNDREADMVEAHAKDLLDKVKTARKKSEWLRGYLASNMNATGILSVKSDDGTFTAKLEKERDVSVDVFDEKQLPADYLAEVPATFKPDKKLIKKALDDGFDVPGARLLRKDRLTLR
jgi:hypothetical protein